MNKFNVIEGSLNVITGCGSGLGRSTLIRFLNEKCGPVLCIDRFFEPNFIQDLNLSDEAAKKVILKTHSTFDENVEPSISEFVSKHGPIDNLLNIAGVAMAYIFTPYNGKIYSRENMESQMTFNTVGTFNMIRLVSKYMIESSKSEKKQKCIINTSTISTKEPSLGQSGYAASNGAIDSMTLCLARELSPYNIRCNTINVGYFSTRLINSDERLLNIVKYVTLCPKGLGHPDQFAHFAQKIVENPMLNGSCIRLDSGARAVFWDY